jgi:hypothetical protein
LWLLVAAPAGAAPPADTMILPQASPAAPAPWQSAERDGVLRRHLWTVTLLALPDGETACEAAAHGHAGPVAYSFRLRVIESGLLLIVARTGAAFRAVHEIQLLLDDGPLATLPVSRETRFGADAAVVGFIANESRARVLGPLDAGRQLTAALASERFTVPVSGFADVLTALDFCSTWRRTHPRGAMP